MMAAPHLVRQFRLAGGQRVGVGHLEDGGHAPHHGGARAGLEIFLVLEPGLTEVHLGVDDAGQDMQAGRVDHLAGAGRVELADGDDLAARDPYIAKTDAVVIDERSAFDKNIVGLRHVRPLNIRVRYKLPRALCGRVKSPDR